MNNTMFFLSLALFIVWMQRHKRWSLFAEALEGNVELKSRTS